LDSLTHSAAMRGPCTPIYAAPEQLINSKLQIDFRTDQFLLGIILAQLLCAGIHPFDPKIVGGDSIVDNIMNDNWVRDQLQKCAPPSLYRICLKMLGNQPYQRFRLSDLLLLEFKNCMGNDNGTYNLSSIRS